jgi:oligosaccharide repeat unit polymerase
VIVVAVPFCYYWITSFSSGYGSNLLLASRVALLEETNEGDTGSIIFKNFASLSIIVAMIAFYQSGHGKKRSFVAIVSALTLNLLTGGRAGIVSLIFALVCLDWIKNRRIHWKHLAVMFLIFVISFSVIAIYLGKVGARADAPLSENIVPVAQGFVLYAAGGLIGFDRVIREPNIIPHNWQINRFFLQTMNKLGARFEVPSLHAEFVSVGPNSMLFNVYTFYFAYLDWGYVGMMGILATLGFIITVFYRKAFGGTTVASLVYSTLFAGLITSIFNEGLLFNLNFLLKLSALYWLLYVGPVLWTRFNQFTSRAVAADIASRSHLESGVLGG